MSSSETLNKMDLKDVDFFKISNVELLHTVLIYNKANGPKTVSVDIHPFPVCLL